MKPLVVFFLVSFTGLIGCGVSKEAVKEEMLTGWVDRASFESPTYPKFKANYDSSVVSQDVIDMVREVHDGVEFLVFFGTWCGDSKRDVPRFLKTADLAGIDGGRIRFYGLDRTKKSGDGLADQHDIHLVPTFIFLKDGKEIGRIVEKPVSSIEDNMLSILATAFSR